MDESIISKRVAQLTARKLAGKGMEMTPAEVAASIDDSMNRLRPALKEKGFSPPDDNREMYFWMRDILRRGQVSRGQVTDTFNALPPPE